MLSDIARPGEVIAARVVDVHPRAAVLSLRDGRYPLHVSHMSWAPLRTAGEVLSIGDRLDVMVADHAIVRALDDRRHCDARVPWTDHCLSRLPLLPNPRDSFELRHREGDVVEVELVDYVNWYIARVLMPDGELVEMRTNDIHAGPRRAGESSRPLRSGERIHVVFRCAHLNRLWMDRYPERDQEYACDAAGYRNARVAGERTSAAQRRFIARRNTPRGGDAGPEGD